MMKKMINELFFPSDDEEDGGVIDWKTEEELILEKQAGEMAEQKRIERAIAFSDGYKEKLKQLRKSRPGSEHFKSLQKLQKKLSVQFKLVVQEHLYHKKNIEFVSISTDESRRSGGSWDAAEKKWRDFVKEKQLSGVQLWAGQDISFQQAYQISGIPRFILIDPQGNIVDANAPRPSDPRLKELLSSLKI